MALFTLLIDLAFEKQCSQPCSAGDEDYIHSVNKLMRAKEDHGSHEVKTDVRADTFLHAKLFYAQRNMYLTGSYLFLSLILYRFHGMIMELIKNEQKCEAVTKQAAQAQKEYMRLLDKDKENETKIEELKKSLEVAEKKAKETDIILKQAKAQNDEYMRLADRYNELEKRLEQRGGEVKKSK
ncbi:hypothetical protein HK102_003731 [Quaeritorhiza haematococci]|nr:hypothetical protein HK102_003731 [Quaeritorhiza haematococci]